MIAKLKIFALGLLLAFGVSMTPASAAHYLWTYTDANGLQANGNLTTDVSGIVTALTGNVLGNAITSFAADPTGAAINDGTYIYDQKTFYGASDLLDNNGLLFFVGGQEYNIYLVSAGVYDLNTYVNGYIYDVGTFTMTAVPEPALWAMLLAGFGLVGACVRRAKRDDRQMALAA